MDIFVGKIADDVKKTSLSSNKIELIMDVLFCLPNLLQDTDFKLLTD